MGSFLTPLKYAIVGVFNTLIHWGVFFILVYSIGVGQSVSNLVGFLIAVTFSYFANAKFTFKSSTSFWSFLKFSFLLGCLAFATGWCAEKVDLLPILTLIIFSSLNYVIGFVYSKKYVFKKVS